jgi:hypothetical protein
MVLGNKIDEDEGKGRQVRTSQSQQEVLVVKSRHMTLVLWCLLSSVTTARVGRQKHGCTQLS